MQIKIEHQSREERLNGLGVYKWEITKDVKKHYYFE